MDDLTSSAYAAPELLVHRIGQWREKVKTAVILTCLGSGMAVIGGCSDTANCSVTYRGGCVAGPVSTPTASPVTVPVNATPAVVAPAVANPAVAPAVARPAVGQAPVGYGDPGTFAEVDDKQCRSYGLTFGSRDYADCRIRLSAQHRGLDPNFGAAPPASR